MKALKNHLILFDAECPMCRMYTQAFVTTGLLENDGRAAYQDIDHEMCPLLDRQRAVNEIALVNQETGEVTYGVKSLFKLFGVAIPGLKFLFNFEPFVWVMSKFYSFIAYNRRVIVPPPIISDRFQLQPTFKLHYRIAYLFFTGLITAYLLSGYAKLINGHLLRGHGYLGYLICAVQILLQSMVLQLTDRRKRWDYLGNMMTISFAGTLLLLPMFLLTKYIYLYQGIYVAWYIVVGGLMFVEHARRTNLLGLGWALTASWVIYQITALAIILIK